MLIHGSPDDARWTAVSTRDPSADGNFYTCVKTTGVYCLASCAGRPKRGNVVFAETRIVAERAGFRPCKRCRPDRLVVGDIPARLAAIDCRRAEAALDTDGFAYLGRLIDDEESAALAAVYADKGKFRSTVDMGRHGFGAGEYRYFAEPPPPAVVALRRGLYQRLAPLASRWRVRLGGEGAYPETHDGYRSVCAAAGQSKPTPLLLSYGPGDYNRLHRDLYGPETFPIQVAILLSEPRKDFEGGEFVLTERRPRMQSRVHVVALEKGDAVAFAVNERPVAGERGIYRAQMRHGVATIRAGRRMTLGVIFHDAA
jgi:hypothetical protein